YILAFEIKYTNKKLNLYLWLAPAEKGKSAIQKEILTKLKNFLKDIEKIKPEGGFYPIEKNITLLTEHDLLRLNSDALKEKFRDKILSILEPSLDIKRFEKLKSAVEHVYKKED
ncbi:MAG: hypothetical protein K5622_07210, partial [Endomicrobiaceae bacterium]|nr:hypothetical protein [Endomicrobiaceae bacterium]